jgi:hypothetical protein
VSQTRETALACELLNWIRAQGRPQSYSINEEQRSSGQGLTDLYNKPSMNNACETGLYHAAKSIQAFIVINNFSVSTEG